MATIFPDVNIGAECKWRPPNLYFQWEVHWPLQLGQLFLMAFIFDEQNTDHWRNRLHRPGIIAALAG
jgi:hypothetical protein